MEIWKDIKSYEGLYQVSNYGNVKRKKILKGDIAKGYLRITLSKSNKQERYLVHRLVAYTFIDYIEGKYYINHKDGNKLNNHINNLEWCSISENEKHAHKFLNKKPPMAKICLDLETGIFYDSVTKAAIAKNIKPTTLLSKLNGQNKNNTSIICS